MRAAACFIAVTLAWAPAAIADDWKDESGKGHSDWEHAYEYEHEHAYEYEHEYEYEHDEWKEEFHDGNCKVERKHERNGAYKEEIKCDGPAWARGYAAPVAPPHGVEIIIGLPAGLPPLPAGPEYGRVYQAPSGPYCREYQTVGTIDGRPQPLYGVACLQPDGFWAFNDY